MGCFSSQLFRFFEDLDAHNDRDWFADHKQRYLDEVRDPALAFVEALAAPLRRLSPHFVADPRPVGGSLFRLHRDTRFSKDKRPYKTHAGIHLRHEQGRDAHCPGFYLHLDPAGCFVGVGLWRPDGRTLARLREALVADPTAWRRAFYAQAVRTLLEPAGESLRTAPRGYDRDHPQIEDLRRKDLILHAPLTRRQVTGDDLLDTVVARFKAGLPLVRWCCAALELPC